MILFHMRAVDEFNRVFGYTQALDNFESLYIQIDRVLQMFFQRMAKEILERMGTDAWACWTCRMEEWNAESI